MKWTFFKANWINALLKNDPVSGLFNAYRLFILKHISIQYKSTAKNRTKLCRNSVRTCVLNYLNHKNPLRKQRRTNINDSPMGSRHTTPAGKYVKHSMKYPTEWEGSGDNFCSRNDSLFDLTLKANPQFSVVKLNTSLNSMNLKSLLFGWGTWRRQGVHLKAAPKTRSNKGRTTF